MRNESFFTDLPMSSRSSQMGRYAERQLALRSNRSSQLSPLALRSSCSQPAGRGEGQSFFTDLLMSSRSSQMGQCRAGDGVEEESFFAVVTSGVAEQSSFLVGRGEEQSFLHRSADGQPFIADGPNAARVMACRRSRSSQICR